jgi:NhaC family Na+:H+ antiporter
MAAVLGVPTLLYLPFCIFNIVSPLLTLFHGFSGIRIGRAEPAAAS